MVYVAPVVPIQGQGSVGPTMVGVVVGASVLMAKVLAMLLVPQPFAEVTAIVPLEKPAPYVTWMMVSLNPVPAGCVAVAPAGNTQL